MAKHVFFFIFSESKTIKGLTFYQNIASNRFLHGFQQF